MLVLAEHGVCSSVVRLAPTVRDRIGCDMVAHPAGLARGKGVPGIIDDPDHGHHDS